MQKQITVAIAGLGNRGRETYAQYALLFPEEMKIVAVADVSAVRRQEAMDAFGLAPTQCFASAEELLAQGKLADVLFICTPDRAHAAQAILALERGYHLLLEKPISPLLAECKAILRAAKQHHRHVAVCHVLRYTAFYREIKRILDAGDIGEIVTIQAIENVGYYHQAHSFVRGNWRNSDETSPMILQKCCHDMDILLWLANKPLKSVSSYGSLYLFRPEKAPVGAAKRCLDGCAAKESCPFDAEKIYITDALTGFRHSERDWPCSVLTPVRTEEAVYQALREGPYGRCVYHCDNNVVDHQVVNLLLADDVTISLTMSGLTSKQYRSLKIMGTRGDLEADMDQNIIRATPFGGDTTTIDVFSLSDDFSGHGGGDNQMVRELLDLVRGESMEGSALSDIGHAMQSHFAAFAAEYSRVHGGESVSVGELENA